VNVYTYRVKEGTGRGKLQYADFDLTLTLHLESTPVRITFSLNYIGVQSAEEAIIFKLKSAEGPSTSDRKRDRIPSADGKKAAELQLQEPLFFNLKKIPAHQKLLLPAIQKENRKQRQPIGFIEEFMDEIHSGKTTIINQLNKSKGNSFGVVDVLRIRRDSMQGSTAALIHLSLQPQRINGRIYWNVSI